MVIYNSGKPMSSPWKKVLYGLVRKSVATDLGNRVDCFGEGCPIDSVGSIIGKTLTGSIRNEKKSAT
jgi:hypothetical protein